MSREDQRDGADAPAPRPRRRSNPLLGALRFLVVLGLFGVAAAVGLGVWLQGEFEREGPSAEARIVTVDPGMGLITLAQRLEGEGVIRDARLFRALAYLEHDDSPIHLGEYEFEAGASLRDVYERIRDHEVLLHRITFPEGRTTAQFMRIIEAAEVLTGDMPEAPEEGAMLPDTYSVTRGTTRAALVEQMVAARTALLEELWPNRAEGLPLETPEEAIILASIVEKETGVGSERARVAAVFVNRLRRGMRLQSDPTIIYGVSGGEPLRNAAGEQRGIRRSELDNAANPYNTYFIAGLTPTPICNPGRAAIEAVLNPAETNDLYFVADGTGGHAFAATLSEHNQNVAAWRRIERDRANGG